MSTDHAATGVTLSGALANLNRDVEIRQALLMRELGVVVGGKEEEEEEIRRFRAPDTLTQAYSDAQAAQQALAEQGGGKKRKLLDEAGEAAKKWALPAGESLVDPNVAPFLAYNEEYFRHITPQDVANLVPDSATRPEDDPDFRIPALGRYYVLEWEDEDAQEAEKALARRLEAMEAAKNKPPTPPKQQKHGGGGKSGGAGGASHKKSHKKKERATEKEVTVMTVSPMENPEELPECCHVCWDGESHDDNQILFCETCEVAVHQACYGIAAVPESGVEAVPAQRLPETYAGDNEAMEPVEGIGNIPRERLQMTCTVCRKRDGACIQCCFGHCTTPVHPMCAFLSGEHRMEIRTVAGEDSCEYLCYCVKHSKNRNAGGNHGGKKRGDGVEEVEGEGGAGEEEEEEEGAGAAKAGRAGAGAGERSAAPKKEQEEEGKGDSADDEDVDEDADGDGDGDEGEEEEFKPMSGSGGTKRGRGGRETRGGRVTRASIGGTGGGGGGTPPVSQSRMTRARSSTPGGRAGAGGDAKAGGGGGGKQSSKGAGNKKSRGGSPEPEEEEEEKKKGDEGKENGEDGAKDEEGREEEEEGKDKSKARGAGRGDVKAESDGEKLIRDCAEAEIRSLLALHMKLSEVSPSQVAQEASFPGGTPALEAWIAPDAAPAAPDHQQPAVRAIRAWLTRKTLTHAMHTSSSPSPLFGANPEAAADAAADVDAAATCGATPMDVDGGHSDERPSVSGQEAQGDAGDGERVGDVDGREKTTGDGDEPPSVKPEAAAAAEGASAGDGAGPSSGAAGAGAGAGGEAEMKNVVSLVEPPPEFEHLYEHTILALSAPPGEMPKEPEAAATPRESSGGSGQPGRPPKCQVCVIHKKGICGTASAPNKCHRRKHLFDKSKAAQSLAGGGGDAAPGVPLVSAEEELAKVNAVSDLMGAAPDDEIVGELLQAQASLARTLWITRTLAAKALAGAQAAAAEEAADRDMKSAWVEETERYEERWRGGKWREEYYRRKGLPSAEAREATAGGVGPGGAGGGGGLSPGGTTQITPGGTRRELLELVDPLVETGDEADALCAVCGGGESEEPNEIVFCERCEVAVHQDCYGVADVPEGDWLCWPCHVAEENEIATGRPPSRPPRWLREAGDGSLYDPRPPCCLCPVKRGALRAVIEPPQPPTPAAAATTGPDRGGGGGGGGGGGDTGVAGTSQSAGAGGDVDAAGRAGVEGDAGGGGGGGKGGDDSDDDMLVDANPAILGPDADDDSKPLSAIAAEVNAREEAVAAAAAAAAENCDLIPPNSPAAARRAALVGYGPGVASSRGGDGDGDGGDSGGGGGGGDGASAPAAEGEQKVGDGGGGAVVRWAHIVCAQCVPGVEIALTPEPGVAAAVVRGLEKVPRSAFEADCFACQRSEGAVVSCAAPGCTLSFHPLCARRNGWLLSSVTHQNSPRHAFCGRHSAAERRRLAGDGTLREHAAGASGSAGGGGGGGSGGGRGGRGRGPGRPPLPGGRGGRGATLGRPKGSYTKRRPPPTREEMELLKRARFGLEKLRLLCERVLRREKFKRQETETQAELWTMQMAGLDDGGEEEEDARSPPATPSRLRVFMTPSAAAQVNATLPQGFAYKPLTPKHN